MSESCPRHKFLLSQYMKEDRYKNIIKYSQPMMRRLQKLSGDKQKTITDNWKLFDTLHVELLNGLKWAYIKIGWNLQHFFHFYSILLLI